MNKKLLIAAFALMLTATAFAQTEADFNVTLTADGTGVVITGYTGRTAQVRIPATIQGMPVRVIGEWAFARSNTNATITSVVIPQGVTTIGRNAFAGAERLASVTIPEGVTEIGREAFAATTALTAITLPQSLTTLGDGAFMDGSGLRTITFPDSLTSIGDMMFWGFPSALTAVTLPASIRYISASAFVGCSALTTVTIPASVERIEFGKGISGSSFSGCSSLNLASQAALRRVGYTGEF